MSMTDPIADLFIRLMNAIRRGHATVNVPASKLKTNVLAVFKSEGFIRDFSPTTLDGHPALQVELRYVPGREKKPVIERIKRVSKPGKRVYVGVVSIPRVRGGLGVAVLSTSKGVMTDRQARQQGIGGEVLCHVW
ncbi:MAG: 30S ribosomal protein S8 [Nitrospira sp.]|nr:30S ribosomal protein S8 [Nitrospira sp.]MCY4133051.1 30S ribosomal protein S8 [Nitrospira sp.]